MQVHLYNLIKLFEDAIIEKIELGNTINISKFNLFVKNIVPFNIRSLRTITLIIVKTKNTIKFRV